MKTTVLYEDKDIIVVHKPAGIATQTARIGQQDVVSELKNYIASRERRSDKRKDSYIAAVHRLDQPVEGVLVFGKTPGAAAALNEQLRSRQFSKKYFAAVCGKPAASEGRLVDYLIKENPSGMAKVVHKAHPQAKKAVLDYRILDTREMEVGIFTMPGREQASPYRIPVSLLDIHILTGRFHQIRAQMAHAGCPLLGDRKYGNENAGLLTNTLQIPNVALCAYHIGFIHPVTGKNMEYTVSPENKAFAGFGNFLQ